MVLSDFGLAYDIRKTDLQVVGRIGGTIQYLAPEAFDETKPFGHAADWWSFGILAHEFFTRKVPYTNFDVGTESGDAEEMRKIYENAVLTIDPQIDEDARDMIERLLQKDVNKRMYAAYELKRHPFFKDIDWDLMASKQFKAPIIKNYADKYDTKSFDTEFTNEPINFVDNSSKNYTSKRFCSKFKKIMF